VKHHHNIATKLKGFAVTGFLVTPVSFVPVVPDYVPDAEPLRFFNGVIRTKIIDEDDFINNIEGNFAVRTFQSEGGPVGRHDHNYFLAIKHVPKLIRLTVYINNEYSAGRFFAHIAPFFNLLTNFSRGKQVLYLIDLQKLC